MLVPVPQILLLLPRESYRNSDFLAAAAELELNLLIGTDAYVDSDAHPKNETVLTVDFDDVTGSVGRLLGAIEEPPAAIIGVDDRSILLAATLSEEYGLPTNSPSAIMNSIDKIRMRTALGASEVTQPRWVATSGGPNDAAVETVGGYPVVIKPSALSQSRGVIRADDREGLIRAWEEASDISLSCTPGTVPQIMVEEYIPGSEYALEGLMADGRLVPLALFEKPDPLEGPYFEETIYVLPARIDSTLEKEAVILVERSCTAIGLTTGPIHAEFRVTPSRRIVIIEIAARSIGGLCSRTLRFSTGASLESLILRSAISLPTLKQERREHRSAAVMMIPTPRSGRLVGVRGQDEARAVSFVEEVDITVAVGERIFAPPRSDRYLGFIFARSPGRSASINALRTAHGRLEIDIEDADA